MRRNIAIGISILLALPASALAQHAPNSADMSGPVEAAVLLEVTRLTNAVRAPQSEPPADGEIRGHVLDASGRSLARVRVELRRAVEAADGWVEFAETDANGVFVFRGLGPGVYRLQVRDGRRVTHWAQATLTRELMQATTSVLPADSGGAVGESGGSTIQTPRASAPTRRPDVSAGFLIEPDVDGSMRGWNVQVSAQMNRRWWLVGELDGSYGRDCRGCEPAYRDFAGLGGVRFGWRPTVRVSPFWQVLAGGLHSSAEGYYYDTVTEGGVQEAYSEGYTVTYLAIQPGGGVTVMATPRFGIRTQADFQIAIPNQSEFEGFSLFPRVVVGALVQF